MQKLILALLLFTGVFTASAQTGSSSLGRCLADSTTGKDRKDLVRWILISMMQHPAMADSITVSPAKLEEINKSAAQVFVRLISVDCKSEVKSALNTGGKAIEQAFERLGTVAVNEVMTDPKVEKAIENLLKYMDLEKLQKAFENKQLSVNHESGTP